MTIRISVNLSNTRFTGLAASKVNVCINAVSPNPYYAFIPYKLTAETVGRPGVSQRVLVVGGTRPLVFVDEAFVAASGNITADGYQASRVAAVIADYVLKGVLIVQHDGVTLTAEQILTFTG